MLQRIQSVYLVIVVVLSLLLLRGSIQNFTNESGTAMSLLVSGRITGEGGAVLAHLDFIWPLVALIVLTSFVSLVTIFLFKKRRIQLILSVILNVLSAAMLALYVFCSYHIIHTYDLKIVLGLKMAVPVLILIFSILACRGILKDDKLVRSYDRLR